MSDDTNKPDYKDTVFLPKTDFPMKAGLANKEPGILARWQESDVYGQLREARAGREKFILHDGPPYANGNIHIGHALNKTLKDMVVRTQSLLGKDAPYVPGWDCHGLPIEWKIEEQYRKKKRNKDEVPAKEFRAECREYAAKWVDVQREEFKRLGIFGEWDKPYLTMDYSAEAAIVEELLKFAESGQLYRGAKPVMWSPVEKTALAEAEVEYADITSTQIDVAFEITEAPNAPELVGAHAVIWTTTPWTIPVNQALAYGADVEYTVYTVALGAEAHGSGNLAAAQDAHPLSHWDGKRLLIATELENDLRRRVDALMPAMPDGAKPRLALLKQTSIKGSDLAGAKAKHPMADTLLRHSGESRNPDRDVDQLDSGVRRSDGVSDAEWERAVEFFTRPRPFLDGSSFVTTEAGTGLVHMAPDHGEDDFDLCKANGINPVFAVDAGGQYREDWPWLPQTSSVINKNFNGPEGPICNDLREAGALLSSAEFHHSYPHSWRSKAKVIYRCTPQWFVPMDQDKAGGTLRSKAMQAIADTRFVPEKGRNRIGSMVEGRPDWVLSRQRAWGVPIALYVDRKSGEYLVDAEVNARIVAAFAEGGADAWFDADHQALLGGKYKLDDYEIVTDILDVWFDSGCTHVFTLESGNWPGQRSPADLYLEGSDQHRGWFQSSLLESCATRGRAPYKQVLTHGFTMDAKGMKMSKSLGNTIDPAKVINVNGADILRLWAASVDFTEDHRIGDEIIRGVTDQYRKLRNSFRYMLGALRDFDESERVDPADMPELERYILHLLSQLDADLREAIADYNFGGYMRLITDFASEDLSAFFFDIRKDCLYCDVNPQTGTQTEKRRAYRSALNILFEALVRYIAPVLVFTAEEIWQTRAGGASGRDEKAGSVHLLELIDIPESWRDDALAEKWADMRSLREDVTEAIEPLRREKEIRSSLEAEVTVPRGIEGIDLSELFISGAVSIGEEISVTTTSHHKCGRCWRLLPDVAEDGDLCGRCEDVVGA